jgi:hypothetical protein
MVFKPYAAEILKVIITNYQNNNARVDGLPARQIDYLREAGP